MGHDPKPYTLNHLNPEPFKEAFGDSDDGAGRKHGIQQQRRLLGLGEPLACKFGFKGLHLEGRGT